MQVLYLQSEQVNGIHNLEDIHIQSSTSTATVLRCYHKLARILARSTIDSSYSCRSTSSTIAIVLVLVQLYPSASQIALSVPWRASAADQTFSVNRKYFIVSCICAQKQYVDFRCVILDLHNAGFALDLDSSSTRLEGE